MVDLRRTPASTNFEDRTDDSPAQVFLTNLMAAFNPVSAYQHVHDKLIEKGIIKVPNADEMLARIDEEIRKRHATERANPPNGFTIDENGIYIPTGDATGLTPEERRVILHRQKK